MSDAKIHNDFYYSHKRIIKANPNLPFTVENLGPFTIISLLQPDLVKEFITNDRLYVKPDEIKGMLPELIGEGLVFTEGKIWKRHRKIISGVFHFEFLKQSIPLIANTAKEIFDKIDQSQNLNDVNIIDEFQISQEKLLVNHFLETFY